MLFTDVVADVDELFDDVAVVEDVLKELGVVEEDVVEEYVLEILLVVLEELEQPTATQPGMDNDCTLTPAWVPVLITWSSVQ